jgi:hypothetical protein
MARNKRPFWRWGQQRLGLAGKAGAGPRRRKVAPGSFEGLEGRQLLATAASGSPDLLALGFQAPAQVDWGQAATFRGTIANLGSGTSPAGSVADVYLVPPSGNASGAVRVGSIALAEPITPGQTVPFQQDLTLPRTPAPGGDGPGWTFHLKVDPQNAVVELNEANNSGQGQGIDIAPTTVAATPTGNLVTSAFGVSSTNLQWGGSVSLTTLIKNQGGGDAPATRARVVLTPADSAPGRSSDVTIGEIAIPAIAGGQGYQAIANVTLPAAPPGVLQGKTAFHLWVVPDADHQAQGYVNAATTLINGGNAVGVQITPQSGTPGGADPNRPNLGISKIKTPTAPVFWGQGMQAIVTLANTGPVDSGATKVQFLLVDPNSPNTAIVLGSASVANVPAGKTVDVNQNLVLPIRMPGGVLPQGSMKGVLAVQVDPENRIDELKENDNLGNSPAITLAVRASDVPPPTTPQKPGGTNNPQKPTTGGPKRRNPPKGTKARPNVPNRPRPQSPPKDDGPKFSISMGQNNRG